MDNTQEQPAAKAGRTGALAAGAIILALGAAAAGGMVLYGKSPAPGKESPAAAAKAPAPGAAGACPLSAALGPKLAPLARGEVASMNIHKAPKPLPPVPFKSAKGEPMQLADLRGKALLVNLWATWCAPCREEMPALDRLQAQAGDSLFEVVAINIDTRRLERANEFLDEIGVKTLARYADPSADIFRVLRTSSQVVGLPTTLIVGPDGCEIGMMSGPAHWDKPDALALVGAAKGGQAEKAASGR